MLEQYELYRLAMVVPAAAVLVEHTVATQLVKKSLLPAGALRQAQSLVRSKSQPEDPRRPASLRQLKTQPGAALAAGSIVSE